MSNIGRALDRDIPKSLRLIGYTVAMCIGVTVLLLILSAMPGANKPTDLDGKSFTELAETGFLAGLGMGCMLWTQLYPDYRVYLATFFAGPIAVYRFCTSSYFGASIGGIPIGIAYTFGFFWYTDKALLSEWPMLVFFGSFAGIITGAFNHTERRMHLRWFWVPVYTVGIFFLTALFAEGMLRACCYLWAGYHHADWWALRVYIDWWAVWLKRGLGAIAAVQTFMTEARKGRGPIGKVEWSWATARNGLLTIGEVGGEGWRALGDLAKAGLAGGAWWFCWTNGFIAYQLDQTRWQIGLTAAVTLAAVPFISFKLGMFMEHLMRAGHAIVPPMDPRPAVQVRVTGTGTVADAGNAGGQSPSKVLDSREF